MRTTDEAARRQRTLRLVLEYDGTDFAGFQIQGKGERTIQGTLEAALRRLSGEECRVHGAGRTDAGVHALGQVAHCLTGWAAPPQKMPDALNGSLPRDLRVRSVTVADRGFHARYDATGRVYRYVVLNRRAPSAVLGRYTLHVRDHLDVDAMSEAAQHLVGVQDFASFGQPDAPGKSTVRDVRHVTVRRWKDCVLITVRGNAFLRQMVRSIAGTLVSTGRGAIKPGAVAHIREGRDRALCPPVAPACGLFLVRVEYDGTRIRRINRDENLFGETE